PAEQVFEQLRSGPAGLSPEEARERRHLYGPNRFLRVPHEQFGRRLLGAFHTFSIYVFLLAAATLYVLDRGQDAAIVASAALLLMLHRFSQNRRARKIITTALCREPFQTLVQRDRHWSSVPVEELVLGDIVRLQAGNR